MRDPITEQEAKDLFALQLKELSRQGAAPNSEALLKAIFARSEMACRAQEECLAPEQILQAASGTPVS